jgi:hypothetical protein
MEKHVVGLVEILISRGLDASVLLEYEYSYHQALQLYYGIAKGYDVSVYADPRISGIKMEIMLDGLMAGLDIVFMDVHMLDNEVENVIGLMKQGRSQYDAVKLVGINGAWVRSR